MRLHIARDIATLFVLEYQSARLRSMSVRDQHTLMPEFPQDLCWETWTLIPIQKSSWGSTKRLFITWANHSGLEGAGACLEQVSSGICWSYVLTSCMARSVLENMSADGERALYKSLCLRLLGELVRASLLTTLKETTCSSKCTRVRFPNPRLTLPRRKQCMLCVFTFVLYYV